jgi:hypothetical protein
MIMNAKKWLLRAWRLRRAGHVDTGRTAAGARSHAGEAAQTHMRTGDLGDDIAAMAFLERLKDGSIKARPDQSDPENRGSRLVLPARELATLGNNSMQNTARLLVTREILCALTSLVPNDDRAKLEASLRNGIEAILITTQGRNISKTFYDALLEEVNIYLNRLSHGKKVVD